MVDKATLVVDGRTRSMIVVRPEQPVDGAPVVLVFHGSNQSGQIVREFSAYTFDRYADEAGTVVIYPDGYKKHWNDARVHSSFAARKEGFDDVAFTRAILDWVETTYHTDPSRVFAIGFSNGGQMVIRLAHDTPVCLAGIAIISATQPVPENFLPQTAEVVALPTMLMHGTKDPLVPYDGGMASLWGFMPRGLGLSASDTAAYYARRNGISTAPTSRLIQSASRADPTSIEQTDYRQEGRPPVTLLTIHGGGHTVPGPKKAPRVMGRSTGHFVAADTIEAFFGLPTYVHSR